MPPSSARASTSSSTSSSSTSIMPSPPLLSQSLQRPTKRRRVFSCSSNSSLVLVLVSSLFLATPCAAQGSRQWQWQFSTSFSDRLPSCQDLRIIVKPWDSKVDNQTHSVPPFYMRSYVIGGLPETTLIGSNEQNLVWTPDQPIGSKLLLNVVDSNQSSGGVPPLLYTIAAGQSTQCIISPPSSPTFTVTANVTDTVQTCEPWGLSIKGGLPPYNLTLAAVNSPIVTNVTMGPSDDHFTYINRADPNSQLMAAINDATGAYAFGTPIVKTAGSADYECIGLVSRGGNSTEIAQQAAAAAAAIEDAKRSRNVRIGVGVGIAALAAIIALLVGFVFWRKKLEKHKKTMDAERARRWEGAETGSLDGFLTSGGHAHSGQTLTVVAFPQDAQSSSPRSTKSAEAGYHLHPGGTSVIPSSGAGSMANSSVALASAHYADAGPFDPYRAHDDSTVSNSSAIVGAPIRPTSAGSGGSSASGSNLTSRPSFAAFPTSSSRSKYSKAAEAGAASGHRPNLSGSGGSAMTMTGPAMSIPMTGLGTSLRRDPSLNTPASPATGAGPVIPLDEDALRADEIVFQHRDGGVVRELPPPYADRSIAMPSTDSGLR